MWIVIKKYGSTSYLRIGQVYDKIEELDKEETGLCNTKKRKIAMSIYVCASL